MVGTFVLVGFGVGVLDGLGVLVGVFVMVGVFVGVLVYVAVEVKVGRTKPVLVGAFVAEGASVSASPTALTAVEVQVAGKARGLAVVVGSAMVGGTVGGGKGFNGIFGFAKTLT